MGIDPEQAILNMKTFQLLALLAVVFTLSGCGSALRGDEALLERLHSGVTCLVKGSRSMGIEHVVQAISGYGKIQEAS